MPNELDPIVGQWYLHRDKGEMFRVVAADAAGGYIEIQYFDGDVEELEIDAWREMDIETAAEPEDWTGPFDEIEPDQLGMTDTAMSPQDWRSSLESLRAAEESWEDSKAADEVEEVEGRPLELYVEEAQEATPSARARRYAPRSRRRTSSRNPLRTAVGSSPLTSLDGTTSR